MFKNRCPVPKSCIGVLHGKGRVIRDEVTASVPIAQNGDDILFVGSDRLWIGTNPWGPGAGAKVYERMLAANGKIGLLLTDGGESKISGNTPLLKL